MKNINQQLLQSIAMLIIHCLYSILFITPYQETTSKEDPKYFLNNIAIEVEKVHLNPDFIDSIRVGKQTPQGEIYIYHQKEFTQFLSLEEVVIKYSELQYEPQTTLFIIDGEMVEDINGILIDPSYFIYCETQSLKKATYLKDQFEIINIIEIDLESKERDQMIYIRGDDRAKIRKNGII